MAINSLSTGFRPGVCTSSTRPTAPYEGQVIYETDTDLSYVWGGAAWQQVSGGTAVGNSGLVFVKQQTIGSAVSSVTVTGAFSTDYDNYQIVVSGGASSANGVMGMTIGAAVTGYYFAGAYCTYGGTVSGSALSNTIRWNITAYNASQVVANVFVSQPYLTKVTAFTSQYIGASSGDGSVTYAGILDNTTSYDSFAIIALTGTLTGGTITVYGYRKA